MMMNMNKHHGAPKDSSTAGEAAVPLEDRGEEADEEAKLQQYNSIPSKKKKKRSKEEEQFSIKIVSAFYRPCEQKQHQGGGGDGKNGGGGGGGGSSAESSLSTMSKLYTRNVTPFVRALLMAQKQQEAAAAENDVQVDNEQQQQQQQQQDTTISNNSANSNVISINAMTANGMKRSKICILDGMMQQQSMNSVFGDPCPGTSKRLYISYSVIENDGNEQQQQDGKEFSKRSLLSMAAAAAAPIHHVSFAEHEKVILNLMNRSNQYQDVDNEEDNNNNNNLPDSIDDHNSDDAFQRGRRPPPPIATVASIARSDNSPWRLRATSSEIILPLVMPYLQIKERVSCRLVCRVWKNIIREWGVATTIDVQNTTAIYSCSVNNNNNSNNNNGYSYNNNYYSRSFIRGILKHSYSALHTLFLSGLQDLNGPCDLHPSIPHLRKLSCLDISHCIQLGDDTLTLLSLYCRATLQVLYVKALPLVTDVGMLAICQACRELQVLDISHLHALTDQTGMAIGQHLYKLRALYMRDNYKITNSSIDLITTRTAARGAPSCGGGGGGSVAMLETLTLWGCMRLKHLNFGTAAPTLPPATLSTIGGGGGGNTITSSGAKLVTLNLWGCHSLTDDWASALSGMHNLKSLVVSECHRLTDAFVVSITFFSYSLPLDHLMRNIISHVCCFVVAIACADPDGSATPSFIPTLLQTSN